MRSPFIIGPLRPAAFFCFSKFYYVIRTVAFEFDLKFFVSSSEELEAEKLLKVFFHCLAIVHCMA